MKNKTIAIYIALEQSLLLNDLLRVIEQKGQVVAFFYSKANVKMCQNKKNVIFLCFFKKNNLFFGERYDHT